MKIFSRKDKLSRGKGNYYFGEYSETPLQIDITSIDEDNLSTCKDALHYHKESTEYYLVQEGEAIIEIEGKDYTLKSNTLVMVEPKERHFVKEVTKLPFIVINIGSIKKEGDKVIVDPNL